MVALCKLLKSFIEDATHAAPTRLTNWRQLRSEPVPSAPADQSADIRQRMTLHYQNMYRFLKLLRLLGAVDPKQAQAQAHARNTADA